VGCRYLWWREGSRLWSADQSWSCPFNLPERRVEVCVGRWRGGLQVSVVQGGLQALVS
jgi:hypothetical protein